MIVRRLFVHLTLFYCLVTGAVFAAGSISPALAEFLPIGGAQTLLSAPAAEDPLQSISIGASRVTHLGGSILWLFIAVAGALLTTLPVTWTYMASRNRSEYDQALVETMQTGLHGLGRSHGHRLVAFQAIVQVMLQRAGDVHLLSEGRQRQCAGQGVNGPDKV